MSMTAHIASKVLSTRYTIDILRLLGANGEMAQKDMRCIISTNNKTISRKLEFLLGWGLVTCELREGRDSRHVSKYWELTEKGSRAAGLLDELEAVLGGSLDEE